MQAEMLFHLIMLAAIALTLSITAGVGLYCLLDEPQLIVSRRKHRRRNGRRNARMQRRSLPII